MSEQIIEPAREDDELYQAQHEIRHLRETIDALREELETQRYEKDRGIQAAHADTADELNQLRDTASALRDDLRRAAVLIPVLERRR